MAITKASDMKVFPDQFQAGYVEVLSQNTNAFNAASANGILLFPEISRGQYQEIAFTQLISGLVTRLDQTSVSAQTPTALTQGSFIAPKLKKKIKEIAITIDAYRSAGRAMSIEDAGMLFSFELGQQVGQAVLDNYLNTALLAGVTCLNKQASTKASLLADSTTTLTSQGLIKGMKTLGDRALSGISCWVMHSKSFFDLMGSQAGLISDSLAGATIYQGSVGSFQKPIIVTDSAYLVNADGVTTGVDSYYTLGLTAGGLAIKETEEFIYNEEVKNGLEQIYLSFQGEFGYNAAVKGFSMTANNSANPDDTALALNTNWTLASASVKDAAGFLLEHA